MPQRDEGAFEELFQRHRRELHVHCYRMTGSFVEAEHLVQETFERAWRGLDGFEGRSSLRAWLYRIATNACLDALEQRAPVGVLTGDAADLLAETSAIQPYPDALLETPASDGDSLDSTVIAKETIELGFIAALLHLPPRQRAVLVVRDVLGLTALETAELLHQSVPSVNSLLQRGRRTLQRRAPSTRLNWARPPMKEDDRAVLRRYIEAHERADADAIVQMLRSDVRITMPPDPPALGAASPPPSSTSCSAPTALASGASSRPTPTAVLQRRTTCGVRATRRSGPSPSTSSTMPAAGSSR